MNSPVEIWWMAARPKTLPATLTPVLVGSAVAYHSGSLAIGPGIAALLGGLMIQIGSNLANDLFDFKRGADTAERLGPTRVTQAGLLSPRQVTIGMVVVFLISVLIGCYLVYVGKWPVIAMGVASIVAAIAYTGGPYPLGYHGLGDLFCFIFFGPVALCGTTYVETLTFDPLAVWVSIPIGLLCTNILVVNNLRDIETDVKAGKRTLAVRIGAKGAIAQYILFGLISFSVPIVVWVRGMASPGVLLSVLAFPLFVKLALDVSRTTGRALNPILGRTAELELIFGILLATGLIL